MATTAVTAAMVTRLASSRCIAVAVVLFFVFGGSSPNSTGTTTRTTRRMFAVAAAALQHDDDSDALPPPCNLTSYEMAQLNSDQNVLPCVVADVGPNPNDNENKTTTSVVTIVQVTPTGCSNHRDGGVTAVNVLNADSNGRGAAIGFHRDHYVKFRLVSIVAGNPNYLGTTEYDRRHVDVLNATLTCLQPQYIAGTCSFKASVEKAPALQHKTIVLSQVGPPGFYRDETSNDYVFGIHINSDEYPIPAIRQLKFHVDTDNHPTDDLGADAQPVRVIYRTKSEFFNSTCTSVLNEATNLGFTDVVPILYDPDGDDDDDGVPNQADVEFLQSLADRACPPPSDEEVDNDSHQHFHPALFACVLSDLETKTILDRWKANGCRPVSLWLTPATWNWANNNIDLVPYVQGGGQWHESFDYGDDYFSTGKDLLDHNEIRFGYRGNYDMVVSYAVPILFSQHIASFFRVVDQPDVDEAFRNRYEELRRGLVVLNANTIFGPVNFNEDRRNVGRGAAGTQWQPTQQVSSSSSSMEEKESSPSPSDPPPPAIENACVSPLSQAEAATVVPAHSSVYCDAGEFTDVTLVHGDECLLCSKCSDCPVDAFTTSPNERLQCNACPDGSTTEGRTGATNCIEHNENRLPTAYRVMGFVFVSISLSLALGFVIWTIKHRKDAVVRISQLEFLTLICLGAAISSSSIIAISFDAGSGEDTSGATMGCRAFPFLFAFGWMLQYSSLSAKSYRLYKMVHNPLMQRRKVTAMDMYKIVVVPLLLDMLVIALWTIVSPLEYEREVTGTSLGESGVVTVNSVGECQSSNVPEWAFIAPLILLHVALMIITNILLWKVRNIGERYQEQKWVALASVYACELFLLGLPVLIAVSDESPEVRYITISGIVFLHDSGMLCLIFIPKVFAQKEGLPQGVTVGQSIMGTPSRRTRYSSNENDGTPKQSRYSSTEHDNAPTQSQTDGIGDTKNQDVLESAPIKLEESRNS